MQYLQKVNWLAQRGSQIFKHFNTLHKTINIYFKYCIDSS
jgi:hypothetical protein